MERKEAAGEDPKTALREYQNQNNSGGKENGAKRKADNNLDNGAGKKGKMDSGDEEDDEAGDVEDEGDEE